MGMAIAVPRYTVEDLERFPDDGNRYELLDGILLVTPSPAAWHQLVANRIQSRLSVAVDWPGHAFITGPGAVVRTPRTQLQPDILVTPSRFGPKFEWDKVTENWLAVEILSRSSRVYDRDFKRDAYFALGVRQVWLVDAGPKCVEISTAPGSREIVRDVIRWRVPTLDLIVSISLEEVFAGL
jgi:Uma2 family endonuclease